MFGRFGLLLLIGLGLHDGLLGEELVMRYWHLGPNRTHRVDLSGGFSSSRVTTDLKTRKGFTKLNTQLKLWILKYCFLM